MKSGLIMEGGAMRGMFTCGVLDILMENGIKFDGAAGISAGAVFGCNYKSEQIGRAIRYNKRYCSDPRYGTLWSWLKTGNLYEEEFCYKELPNILDPFDIHTFEKNPMDFYVGAFDIESGKVVYHKCKDGGAKDLKWLQASASMPLVSKPVEIEGHKFLDGGIADAMPYGYMKGLGYDRNLIILTQPKGYMKPKTAALWLMRLTLGEYPKLIEAMKTRHERYNRQIKEIDELEASGKVFVIRPPEPLGITRTEKSASELERVYQLGRREALEKLPALREFFN